MLRSGGVGTLAREQYFIEQSLLLVRWAVEQNGQLLETKLNRNYEFKKFFGIIF